MPNRKSQKKSLLQNKKKQLVNKAVKDSVKKLIKDSRTAIDAKSDQAGEMVKQTSKAVDKAVQKGVFKKNAGNRKKSRLMKKFNAKFEIGKSKK